MEEKMVSDTNSLLVRFTICSRILDPGCFSELTGIVQDLSEQRVGVEEE